MRLSHVIFSLAGFALAAVPPLHAEDAVNAPVYIVTYFEVTPQAAAESAVLVHQFAETSRKEDANVGFEVFAETARPNRFAVLEVWRDKKAAEAHAVAAGTTAFHEKLRPLMIGGLGVRPHSGLSVAGSHPGASHPGLYIITHVDVFPTFKDQAIELVKAQADAGRKDIGNLRFDVLQWDGHPNHFTLVEAWRDPKAFDAGIMSAHTRDFRQKLTPLEGALYDERLYKAVR